MAVHVIIPTHTSRHLDTCLAGLSLQTMPPRTVIVTCDSDDAAVGRLLEDWWPRVAGAIASRGLPVPGLLYAFRAHQGRAMLNQVRNNGLRALENLAAPRDEDLVLVLDGDTILAREAIAQHAALAEEGYELVIPFRVNLDAAATERLTADAILAGARDHAAGPGELAGAVDDEALAARQRRYRRQLLMRRFIPGWAGLPKRHKPKILGGHHAVSVQRLRAVNGYDEEYQGYGFDDDDLSRRLYGLEPPPKTAIAVRQILAFHLYHPTRAPARPVHAPGYARFRREDLPVRALHGWESPLPQPQVQVAPISPDPFAGPRPKVTIRGADARGPVPRTSPGQASAAASG
jgi:hypothetical protein